MKDFVKPTIAAKAEVTFGLVGGYDYILKDMPDDEVVINSFVGEPNEN
ncbi:hypothetical protein [Aliivibrio kagoshimensis]